MKCRVWVGGRERGSDSPKENQNEVTKGSGKGYWLGQTINTCYFILKTFSEADC